MALKELLSELEKEIQFKNVEPNLYINQPSLITLSSDSTNDKSMNLTADSFYTFTCNLKKPAIGAKSLQLLSANIPQAKGTSFSDTELIFPYYRIKWLRNVAGYVIYDEEPSLSNIHYVRLLPSYYPSNIIPNAESYGFNKTFNNYLELSVELEKSCANDLYYTNIGVNFFIPNDVLISYNETENKFQMKGNNTNEQWAIDAWSSSVTYERNDLVIYQDNVYICLATVIIVAPGGINNNFWRLETSTRGYTYLVAGFQDPNVLALQQALNSTINGQNIDFIYSIYENDGTQLTNIVGIPPQPFAEGKTLAKRLGFTWNGRYVWDSGNPTDPLYYNSTTAGSGPLLWNRLRPIPDYSFLPPEGLEEEPPLTFIQIPNNNPFTSDTFIAEAYCNLVYSSILNIYSQITTASSIDTQSTNNIISIIPINCGQLGITFTNNYLENPLTKINADIYQIRIELRDEIGEPYYISNNGIVTLMLKISY